MNVTEIAANAFNAASIFLAGRNSMHMWWTTIVGCVLFAYVFFAAKLYADVTLQMFFIGTGVLGWWRWRRGRDGIELPVRHSHPSLIAMAAGFTDAYAPFVDSMVLAFSVLGQLLLIERRVENWWCWLLVNTIAVPLYTVRGLYLTALLYSAFWVNAIVSLIRWNRLAGEVNR
jgi:nicotinamide mononucleotide transporter